MFPEEGERSRGVRCNRELREVRVARKLLRPRPGMPLTFDECWRSCIIDLRAEGRESGSGGPVFVPHDYSLLISWTASASRLCIDSASLGRHLRKANRWTFRNSVARSYQPTRGSGVESARARRRHVSRTVARAEGDGGGF